MQQEFQIHKHWEQNQTSIGFRKSQRYDQIKLDDLIEIYNMFKRREKEEQKLVNIFGFVLSKNKELLRNNLIYVE